MGSDVIYRQDTIDAINTWDKFGIDERSRVVRWREGLEPYVKLSDVVWAIAKLPSAEPQRKTGKWLTSDDMYETGVCSCCRYDTREPVSYVITNFEYCPNCGAKMEGENDLHKD